MTKHFFVEGRPQRGFSYAQYINMMQEKAANAEKADGPSRQLISTNPDILNYRRTLRIEKSYSVNPGMEKLIKEINKFQLWMVLTESWCGDSAQNLPYIAKLAAMNPKIELKILLRDQNLDIMDLYLTNGISRSIPKLVSFDTEGNELFQWGPRPAEAQGLMSKLKSEGKEKKEYIEALHLWYGRDKGKSLENEFLLLIGDSANK